MANCWKYSAVTAFGNGIGSWRGIASVSPETARRLRDRAALAGLTDRITFHGALRKRPSRR